MNSFHKKAFHFIAASLFMVIYGAPRDGHADDFGYLLNDDNDCALWWAEGAYKVMQQGPVPLAKSKSVHLKAAMNEFESFQVVLRPHRSLEHLRIEAGSLTCQSGHVIPAAQFTIRTVEYVHVIRPTDYYGKPGWYPDPLPLMTKPASLSANQNHPFWITVKVPESAVAGKYSGILKLKADGWEKSIPIELEVWNFALPGKPAIRSAFGISPDRIRQYHHLTGDDELKTVTDLYYRAMSEYKIAPTSPFRLYPMKVSVEGLFWKGGIFTSDTVFAGQKALKITDNDAEENIEAATTKLIPVDPSKKYLLRWNVRTRKPDQKYCVLVQCYDNDRDLMPFENRMDVFTGSAQWGADTLNMRPFRKEIHYVTVHLFPVFRDLSGRHTGTAWFDNVRFAAVGEDTNLIPQGDFEVTPEALKVQVDFSDFDVAGEQYLDGLGFNAFHLPLEGLPSGNFYTQKRGVFHGFAQGTPEYDKMMKKYLGIVQDHLEAKGWLGKEYVYWFDEPNTENYPFVREGMEIIHRAAPKITRFITEHQPGPDIMDVTEISCTVIGKLDPAVIKDLTAKGREFWSYVCCCPKAPYLSLFIDHDAINMRMWLWLSYKYRLKGILVWSANYWNSPTASPKNYLQNPWEDPMSYTTGYGFPWGKQAGWGNGDGRFFYPPDRNPNENTQKVMEGPVPCIRLELLRDGIEDYEYLVLLQKVVEKKGERGKAIKKAQKLLSIPDALVEGPTKYDKDPQAIIRYRNELGELLDAVYGK